MKQKKGNYMGSLFEQLFSFILRSDSATLVILVIIIAIMYRTLNKKENLIESKDRLLYEQNSKMIDLNDKYHSAFKQVSEVLIKLLDRIER